MRTLVISSSNKKAVLDITTTINKELSRMRAEEGLCHLFITHTTASLTTADLDPGTDLDMLDAFDKIMPKLQYRHPHNPSHAPDHILSSIIGASLTIPVSKGKLVLGVWQRVVLIELDGPRDRTVIFSFTPSS